nr:hypothetical protein [Tanacetum cinerariifolium]
PSAGPNRGSKRQKEGGEQASASTPSKKATKGAGGSTTGTQSQQQSASQSAYAEEPVQTTCQMEETPLPPRKPPSPDRAWNTALPAAQGDAQLWISDLAKQADARSSFNELLDTPIDFSNFIMHRLNQPIDYNKYALWGVSHWGQKRKQFYGYAVTESLLEMYTLKGGSSLLLNFR